MKISDQELTDLEKNCRESNEDEPICHADFRFYLQAREAIPRLIERVRELENQIVGINKMVKECDHDKGKIMCFVRCEGCPKEPTPERE